MGVKATGTDIIIGKTTSGAFTPKPGPSPLTGEGRI